MIKKIAELFAGREFVSIATCSLDNTPNAVPKFVLKTEGNIIYLVDYVRGQTLTNLKVNSKVSIPVMDNKLLVAYRVNGAAEIVESGAEYKKLMEELRSKVIASSVARVIEGVRSQTTHENFQATFPDKVCILKVTAGEVVEIDPAGKLHTERLKGKNVGKAAD